MRWMKSGLVAAALVVLLSPAAMSAQTIAIDPALATIIAGAKREGKLLIRSTPASTLAGPEAQHAAQQGIERMFGVDIPIEWSPGAAYGPLAAQLYQEKQAGIAASTDVLALTPPQIVPYLDKGLFRTIDWQAAMPSLPPDLVEAGGKALRVALSLPNILYNPKAAPWVADIANAGDLLKPEYKGKFVTTPFLGGFDALLADDVWGVAKTTAYIKQFAGQIAGFASCGSVDRIASGELAALALDCGGGWPNNLRYRGTGLIATKIVSDIAERRYAYITIPTHAAHPNAAILYALYLDSPEGQRRVMADYNGFDLGLYPGSYARKVLDTERAKGVKFTDVTVDWWKTHPHIDREVIDLIKLVQH
ncbi:MAG TPA: extracellular solute-binding protein [Stellaceae bacterium]|nr:extracellular solute-binding protein [Stellaceae bacterium]